MPVFRCCNCANPIGQFFCRYLLLVRELGLREKFTVARALINNDARSCCVNNLTQQAPLEDYVLPGMVANKNSSGESMFDDDDEDFDEGEEDDFGMTGDDGEGETDGDANGGYYGTSTGADDAS